MKSSAFVLLTAVLCAGYRAPAQIAPPACPSEKGAYYLQKGAWVSMDPSHAIGFKTTNVAGAAFSYGIAKAHIKAMFRGPQSPYQLTEAMAICLVGVTDGARDLTLAKFQEEKDRREIAMASLRAFTGVNAQIDPKSVVPIAAEKKGDRVYLITSKESLPPGEFILFTIVPDISALEKANTPQGLGGYDFGSRAK